MVLREINRCNEETNKACDNSIQTTLLSNKCDKIDKIHIDVMN
jgi:hypothetical protein